MWVSKHDWELVQERLKKLEEKLGEVEVRSSPFLIPTGQEQTVFSEYCGVYRRMGYEPLAIKDAVKKLADAMGYDFVATPKQEIPALVEVQKVKKKA
jgi:hypothetical protein